MSGSIELFALTAIAALFPACMHFGALRGAPLRPPVQTQLGTLERLIFRQLPVVLVLNGALVGAAVFLTKTGSAAAAIIVGLFALPGLVTQLTALTIAKSRDVAGAGG